MTLRRVFTALCFFLGVTSLHAQVGAIKIKVPFEFTVASKVLPAGEYSVASGHNSITVRDAAGRSIAMANANPLAFTGADKNGSVIFDCYSDRCFLAEIWASDPGASRQLLVPQQQVLMARQQSVRQIFLTGR